MSESTDWYFGSEVLHLSGAPRCLPAAERCQHKVVLGHGIEVPYCETALATHCKCPTHEMDQPVSKIVSLSEVLRCHICKKVETVHVNGLPPEEPLRHLDEAIADGWCLASPSGSIRRIWLCAEHAHKKDQVILDYNSVAIFLFRTPCGEKLRGTRLDVLPAVLTGPCAAKQFGDEVWIADGDRGEVILRIPGDHVHYLIEALHQAAALLNSKPPREQWYGPYGPRRSSP